MPVAAAQYDVTLPAAVKDRFNRSIKFGKFFFMQNLKISLLTYLLRQFNVFS